ncbi:MAG: signal peptidase I [Gammaproteobacteria bacterium]|jgi:signal peptidase I|nr:signal peptidase I [Gammaproteobacteria bacterium]MBQ0774531.1 signal peptidase I [Gammaproteobacteria bacterium]|tara:strand:+ start:39044 stop:39877 length:834 start_codon:yes stop_codon:yes gene_type:complete
MDIDIGFWLTILVAITGTTWLIEKWILKTKKDAPQHVMDGLEFSNSLLPVFFVVLVVRSFLFEPFTIPSGSMIPTLQVHDFVLVNKFSYGLRLPASHTLIVETGKPQRGDVMVFRYPEDPSKNYIKRVIGVPGDKIEIRGLDLYINDALVDSVQTGESVQVEACVFSSRYRAMLPVKTWSFTETIDGKPHLMQRRTCSREDQTPHMALANQALEVPEDSYFVMGDNRDNSQDSRFWGFVPKANIVGKASIIWMHWEGFTSLPSFSRNGAIDKLESKQ